MQPDKSAPGTFPFLHDGDYYNGDEQIDSYKIPLSALSDYFGIECNEEFNIYEIFIAAHAEVTPIGDSIDIYSEESAWAGDPENPLYICPDKNWAMYFYCEIPCDFNGDSYTYYQDSDADRYGNPDVSVTTTDPEPPPGYVADNTDCEDTDPAVHPGATEICDGKDNDCDGIIPGDETADTDSDGIIECTDNCPDVWNPDQADSDGNGIGAK